MEPHRRRRSQCPRQLPPVHQIAGVRDRPPPLRGRAKAGRTAEAHARSPPPLAPPGPPETPPPDRVDHRERPRRRADGRRTRAGPPAPPQTDGISPFGAEARVLPVVRRGAHSVLRASPPPLIPSRPPPALPIMNKWPLTRLPLPLCRPSRSLSKAPVCCTR